VSTCKCMCGCWVWIWIRSSINRSIHPYNPPPPLTQPNEPPHNRHHQAKLKKKRLSKYNFDATTSRVVPLTDESPNWGKHFGQADMVIEVG
jgi:hypothetical protein